MKLEEERDQENFISFVETYYELTPANEKKGVRQLHHDFNKQKSNRQIISREYSFRMTFSENRNGLGSTIVCSSGRNKQGKCYSKHKFPLHIHQKSKHNSGEFRYEVSQWYSINFQWILGMKIIGRWGRESTNVLVVINPTWQVFGKNFHKN